MKFTVTLPIEFDTWWLPSWNTCCPWFVSLTIFLPFWPLLFEFLCKLLYNVSPQYRCSSVLWYSLILFSFFLFLWRSSVPLCCHLACMCWWFKCRSVAQTTYLQAYIHLWLFNISVFTTWWQLGLDCGNLSPRFLLQRSYFSECDDCVLGCFRQNFGYHSWLFLWLSTLISKLYQSSPVNITWINLSPFIPISPSWYRPPSPLLLVGVLGPRFVPFVVW